MRIDVMTKNIRNLALATMSGFRHKTVDVPEWEEATVVLREPSAEAWLRWQEIVKAKDDETPLSVAERARRNLEADVELFIDVLCDTGLQPVFSEDDREQVIAVYGPVHGRLLRQSLELISDAGEVKKK
ncbi:phage tail protein [Escherichia coli]|nr:phage tail protein [Escherichia coli]EFB6295895.1 phage tail protein [Escherichia coli]EFF0518068.1 phage tail protein [Escherichia coli]EFJ5697707.1 phage tail protein [Escherichia coli]EFJ5721715.1 phage tail protein [Escherichia coli]